MSTRPKLLDLFCGAGGCSVGYHRAGFDVVGVDNRPMPRYPFPVFTGDAMSVLALMLNGARVRFKHGDDMTSVGLGDISAIHASPPCQRYTVGKHIHGSWDRHPDLVETTRKFLQETRLPWVIENVPQAPLHRPVLLCGTMFGLRVLRHRLFESSQALLAPPHRKHPRGNLTNSKSGYSTDAYPYITCAGHNFVRTAGMAAMGIDWEMTREEVANAIPPAYTEYIGKQLIRACQKAGAA